MAKSWTFIVSHNYYCFYWQFHKMIQRTSAVVWLETEGQIDKVKVTVFRFSGHYTPLTTPILVQDGQASPDLPSCSGTVRWSCWSGARSLCGWHPGCGGHTHSLAGQTGAGEGSWLSGWWASLPLLGSESPRNAPAGGSPGGKGGQGQRA